MSLSNKNILTCIVVSLLLLIIENLFAQSVSPEKVIGKISMRDGSNLKVNGTLPVIGHNIVSSDDAPQNLPPSIFTRIDAGMMKVFNLTKSVSDLNPPVGFDAWYQMNTYHTKPGNMYSGWLRVWMFPYHTDSDDPNKIDLSSETGLMVWVYVNDPSELIGNHEYFTDTLHYTSERSTGNTFISYNDDHDMEIIHKQKSLFRPYTIGEFLIRQKKFYEKELAENNEDLENDQDKVSSASSSTNSSIKELKDNIKDLQDDIADRQEDLKTADSQNKSMIQSIIDNDKKNIATLKKTIAQLSSGGQQQLNNDLSNGYQTAVDKDQNSINEYTQIIQQISNEYNHLTNEQRNQQAYIKPGKLFSEQDRMNTSDLWDEDFVTLLTPGNKSGAAAYCYNSNYFDKTSSSEIQLIVMKYGAKENNPIANKQWEIIQQINQDQLKGLILN